MRFSAIKLGALSLLATTTTTSATSSENGEEARWLVNSTLWGTLQWVEPSDHTDPESALIAQSTLVSFGETDGRIFYYLPMIDFEFRGSLTLSEAQVDTGLFEGARCGDDGDLDPEDPRCAKLTVSGTITPCSDDTLPLALSTLFRSHPQMENWPPDHGFSAFEMTVDSLWMIANYGGGGFLSADEYYDSSPVHHPGHFPVYGDRRTLHSTEDEHSHPRPEFGADTAAHARWLVAKSLWTTISTVSSRGDSTAFGNIRSVVDGGCFLDSSGLPFFYLPSPDPTSVDVIAGSNIVLSFTEAGLPNRVGEDGVACGGMDAMDPTCARITLEGSARVLEEGEVTRATAAFGMQHPRADWLSKGGAHTGGAYYTIDVEAIEFFRDYGGAAELTVEEYTNWVVPDGGYDGEEECSTDDWDGGDMENGEEEGHYHHDAHSGGEMHDHGEHENSDHGMGEGHHEHGEWGEDHDGWGEGHHEHGMEEGHHEHGEWGEGHHEHGEWGEGHDEWGEGHHEHGEHGEGHREHEHYEEYASESQNDKDNQSAFSTSSFIAGTAFGLLLWGPTLAMIVYHKRCGGCRNRHGDTSVEYKPAVMA